jgi:acyl-[acyl-carrier-protein]-phospholipid O-acyltransferase / long-chain-fatty-acid--[acyl-carrier-protein] ligase
METPVFGRRSYVPYFFEIVAVFLARILYRVSVRGAERVPEKGGVLLLANHLSYVDVIALQLACPRRLRFVGYAGLREHWFIGWIFRMTGTIPISPRNAVESIRRISAALSAGEVVCLFPEGSISRTGQLMEIRKGFELMARRAKAPVVPVAHDGLWGSVFSFSGNKYLFKSPRLMPTPVSVCFGHPIPAEQATAARIRRELLDLGCEAFSERPVLKRHLGREVVRSLAKRPGSLQVVDRTGERRALSAGRLLAVSAALSRRIRKNIPERRVGIVLPPGAGAFIANIAVVCAGKVPVNLNFTAGRAAVESSLRLGEIKTVLTADAVRAKLPNFPWPERSLDLRKEIEAAGKPAVVLWLAAAWILPNQLLPVLLGLPKRGDTEEAGLLFTSGSSGEPKGVVLSHRNLLANCWQISSLSILPDTAILMACLPIFHSFGFTVTLWYPLLRGCHVVTVPSPLDTRKIVDAIREEEVSVLIGAPTFLRPMLKRAEPAELRSLDLVVSGAEKMPLDLYEAFVERFHIEIMQGYGLTETTPVANVNQHNPPVITETAELQEGKRLGSVGRMLPGMTARIIDPDTGVERALTDTGILWFRGANVFGGYLHDEEKTRAALRDGWFITGDLARFDEAGFLYIEGRLSRFSKIGGEMVPHGTVEQKIADAFGWEQLDAPAAVVMGVPDAAKGEALVLLTTQEVTGEQVRDRLLAAGLPALWVPKIIKRVAAIPMLGTGKLDLKGCKQLASEAAA